MNDTATTAVLLAAALWGALTMVGLVALAAVRRDLRDRAAPAAPLVGVVLLVVVLHATSWFLPVRAGAWLVVPVLVGLGVLSRRRGDGFLPGRRALATTAAAAAAGVLPLLLGLHPAVVADEPLVHPAPNNDAYYYVSVADWLVDEPGTRVPDLDGGPRVGGDSIAAAPARSIITQHLRLGESLVQATASLVGDVDTLTLWYPATALWLALLPGGVAALFGLLRLGTVPGLLAGLLAGLAPLGLYQVLNQNSASTLGLAVAPLALGLMAARLHERRAVPLWLVSVAWAGWVGTYTEYLALGVPAVLGMVVVRAPRDVLPALGDAVRVAVVAVLMAPFVVWNAALSLLFLGGLAPDPGQPSPYLRVTWQELLNRLTMASTLEGGQEQAQAASAVALVLGLGLLAAVVLGGPARGLVFGLVGGAAVGYLAYSVGDTARPYNLGRLVALAMPLVVVGAAVGWTGLQAAARGRGRAAGAGAAVVAVLAGAVVGGVHLRVDRELVVSTMAEGRAVDDTFAEAAAWVDELGGEDGSDVLVVVPSFHSQLWLADALRERPAVSYGVLDTSYFQQAGFWDGGQDRFVLVDRSTWVGGRVETVRENERFRLLDGSAGLVVASPVLYPPYAWAGAAGATWSVDDGELFVWRSPDVTGPVTLQAGTSAELAPLPVEVDLLQVGGSPLEGPPTLGRVELGVAAGPLHVDLPDDAPGGVVVLGNLEAAVPAPSLGVAVPLSVRVEGVSGGS